MMAVWHDVGDAGEGARQGAADSGRYQSKVWALAILALVLIGCGVLAHGCEVNDAFAAVTENDGARVSRGVR